MWHNFKIRSKITIVSSLILLIISLIFAVTILKAFNEIFIQPIQLVATKNNEMNQFTYNQTSIKDNLDLPTNPSEVEIILTSDKSYLTLISVVIIIVVIVNILGTFLIYYATKKLLKPLEILTNHINTINSDNLHNQIALPNKNDEVYALSNAFNKMLLELDSSFNNQRNFSINVAHELKTPLTTIKTNLDVLKLVDNPSKQDYQAIINRVTRSSDRLRNLVLSLLELRDNSIKYEQVDLNKLIYNIDKVLSNEYFNDFRIDIIGKKIIQTDYFLIERILYNIIENSLKYSNRKPIVLISLLEDRIIIKDNGIGIAHDKILNVSKPFYCIDNSRSKEYGGYGLGLSIVKDFCSRLEYQFEITSIIDKSTTITILLKKST